MEQIKKGLKSYCIEKQYRPKMHVFINLNNRTDLDFCLLLKL